MANVTNYALSADGTPIVTMKVIDTESGTETPVNVLTCTEAVVCPEGKTAQEHLAALYGHAKDESVHLTPEQKESMETQQGAHAKAEKAKSDAVTAASLLIENAKAEASTDATTKAIAARDAAYRYTDSTAAALASHEKNNSNPHGVTAAQVGLGNVPNKSTNNQEPTYTVASTLTGLTNGEKLTVAFGKIAKAIADLIAHIGNKSNPHGVTASQAGAIPKTGGTMTGNLTVNGLILTEGKDYGTTLPAAGTKGRIFFKKV